MSHPLAIVTPRVGAATETFVRRHIEDLLPGRAVVLSHSHLSRGAWSVAAPYLDLDGLRAGLLRRGTQAVARRFGVAPARPTPSRLRQFFRRHGVSVVMGEYMDASLEWLAPVKEMGLRFYVHAHGYDVSRRLRDPRWRTAYIGYKEADGVVTINQITRGRLVGLGLDPARVHVVPYGVDLQAPGLHPNRAVVRCLAVGRMVAKKAPIFLLDAFRRALALVPAMHLDVVGGGRLMPAARQYVAAFGLQDAITLHGHLAHDAVLTLMGESDIFVQHSIVDEEGDEEGLPIAILEAMARGLPVVSTRHAGIPEAVDEGVTGVLVDEGDCQAMAEQIVRLAGDRSLRTTLGDAGQARVRAHFTWEEERRRLLDIMGLA